MLTKLNVRFELTTRCGHGQEEADNISTSGLLFTTGGTNGIPNVIAENIVR